jgi:3-methyladenine DNA glycosylase AlkC
MKEIKRKGARTMKDIPQDILNQLNAGTIETVTLVEWLATDRKILLSNVLTPNNRDAYLKLIAAKIDGLQKKTVMPTIEVIVTELAALIQQHDDQELLSYICKHRSDIVRGWAANITGQDKSLTIDQMLRKIQPFAADNHAFVREEAWASVRLQIIDNLEEALVILSVWAKSEDANLRRFATESTRPRGVWCKHIEKLKENPGLALPLLEPLKSDESKYVRDSVGNWLNDASKTKPQFVKELCEKWASESDTKETKHIIRKALRTMVKHNNI